LFTELMLTTDLGGCLRSDQNQENDAGLEFWFEILMFRHLWIPLSELYAVHKKAVQLLGFPRKKYGRRPGEKIVSGCSLKCDQDCLATVSVSGRHRFYSASLPSATKIEYRQVRTPHTSTSPSAHILALHAPLPLFCPRTRRSYSSRVPIPKIAYLGLFS
jgi:hypothetical protein